jgi:hypothetical protein
MVESVFLVGLGVGLSVLRGAVGVGCSWLCGL